MNVAQMHIGVNLNVDRIASNITDDLLPEEIDYYLNEAQEEYIKQQFSFLKAEKSPESQYANENLRTLIKREEIVNQTIGSVLGGETPRLEFLLPNDYEFYIDATLINAEKEYNLTYINSKESKMYRQTEFNLPLFREFPILIEGSKVFIIPEHGVEPTDPKLLFKYLSTPNTISLDEEVDSNLPRHTHDEIVRIAASKILNDLQPRVEQ